MNEVSKIMNDIALKLQGFEAKNSSIKALKTETEELARLSQKINDDLKTKEDTLEVERAELGTFSLRINEDLKKKEERLVEALAEIIKKEETIASQERILHESGEKILKKNKELQLHEEELKKEHEKKTEILRKQQQESETEIKLREKKLNEQAIMLNNKMREIQLKEKELEYLQISKKTEEDKLLKVKEKLFMFKDYLYKKETNIHEKEELLLKNELFYRNLLTKLKMKAPRKFEQYQEQLANSLTEKANERTAEEKNVTITEKPLKKVIENEINNQNQEDEESETAGSRLPFPEVFENKNEENSEKNKRNNKQQKHIEEEREKTQNQKQELDKHSKVGKLEDDFFEENAEENEFNFTDEESPFKKLN